MKLNKLFEVGEKIGGFCNGYFGRDDYDNKTCVMVTSNYAVFVDNKGFATVINQDGGINEDMTSEWKSEASYD